MCDSLWLFNTEHDRAKVPPYNGNDPCPPLVSKSPSVSTPIKQSTKQGNARGTSEVRHGTSSIHFPCPAPRSSSHISGISKPRFCQTYGLQFGAFHENDGNHENDEDNSDSHKQGGWLLDSRKSRKARKWRKPRESRVQNIGFPKPRLRKTRIPFTPKFLQINSLPFFFFFVICFVIFTGIRCGHRFFL